MVSVEETQEQLEVIEFDLSDPSLATYSPDIDVEDIPKQRRPAPPPDGYHFVKARLGNREGGPVYIKGSKGPDGKIVDGRVVAFVDCRIYNRETGEEGAFLNTWYPTSSVMKGQKGSQLTAICYLAGKPVKSGASLIAIKNHVEQVFAEAGEDGIILFVKTRWVKSLPKVEEMVDSAGNPTGLYAYVYKEGTEFKEYEPKIYGESKIKKLMALQGVDESLAHLWMDPVTGDEKSVGAEVASLEDPTKFEFQS